MSSLDNSLALGDIVQEYNRACVMFGPPHSAHEAYAILLEEVDELWNEIKHNPQTRDVERMRKEAVQVAAMALRLITDICDRT